MVAKQWCPNLNEELEKLGVSDNDYVNLAGGDGNTRRSRTRNGGNRSVSFATGTPTRAVDANICSPCTANPIDLVDNVNNEGTPTVNSNNSTRVVSPTNADSGNIGNNNNNSNDNGNGRKPPSVNHLLAADHVQDAFSCFHCPKCGGELKVSIPTVGIASRIVLSCLNAKCCNDCNCFDKKRKANEEPKCCGRPQDHCDWAHDRNMLARTKFYNERVLYKETPHLEDYAINMLHALGFLSCGDGGTEAGRALGVSGMPNNTSMESSTFSKVEQKLGPTMRELRDQIIKENLIEEVRQGMVLGENEGMRDEDRWDEATFNGWKLSLDDPSVALTDEEMAQVEGSCDHVWQQKGSGHTCDSLSGHGCTFGRHTKKVVALSICSKKCNECTAYNDYKNSTQDDPALPQPEHRDICWKNHEGSSGSVESSSCLKLIAELWDNSHTSALRLCCDDDSSVRSDCKWNNKDWMENNNASKVPEVYIAKGPNKDTWQERDDNGMLRKDTPEPKFVADPNHRRKGLAGELIKLDKMAKKKNYSMTRNDSLRLSKNFACAAKQIHLMSQEAMWVKAAKAMLEHHCNNHDFCGDWCSREGKDNSTAELEKKKLFYRDKNDKADMELHRVLEDTIEKYTDVRRLRELNHDMHTNINEAFNCVVMHFAPKNKIFCGSGSLHNRISFAVGVHSCGWLVFMERLLEQLQIAMPDAVRHYLSVKENNRQKKLARMNTKTHRTNRSQKKRNKYKFEDHKNQAQKDRQRRRGIGHCGGLNINDPKAWHGTEEWAEFKNDNRPAKKKRNSNNGTAKKPTKRKTPWCPFCGLKGHATAVSQKCKLKGNKDAPKLHRKEDGVLLSTLLPDNSDGVPAAAAAAPAQEEEVVLSPQDIREEQEDFDTLQVGDDSGNDGEEEQQDEDVGEEPEEFDTLPVADDGSSSGGEEEQQDEEEQVLPEEDSPPEKKKPKEWKLKMMKKFEGDDDDDAETAVDFHQAELEFRDRNDGDLNACAIDDDDSLDHFENGIQSWSFDD